MAPEAAVFRRPQTPYCSAGMFGAATSPALRAGNEGTSFRSSVRAMPPIPRRRVAAGWLRQDAGGATRRKRL